jgi:hypothetical protein
MHIYISNIPTTNCTKQLLVHARGRLRIRIRNLLLLKTRREVVAMAAPDWAFAVGKHVPGRLQPVVVVMFGGSQHSHSLLRGDQAHWSCWEGAHELLLGRQSL